ncbi:predicted protein [Chaetoceros tenuissimus]|uniref:Uncharacterized protein n=1 Tax=Chaetoceros tenuissimus TaxID=426638 RepID=A0AAD3D5N7_9STRA|nr:predicted protein [Chaetoceros tenuissimus]
MCVCRKLSFRKGMQEPYHSRIGSRSLQRRMGKKSKRKKGSKVDANEVVLNNIFTNVQKLASFVEDNIDRNHFSEAASGERDIITYVASKENAITKASRALAKKTRGDRKQGNHFGMILTQRYRSLVYIEYVHRKNYDKVIEIHNEFASKYSHVVILGTNILEGNFNTYLKLLQFFYELALLRTDKSRCNIPIIVSFIVREMRNKPTEKVLLWKIQAIEALRSSKEYGLAVTLDGQISSIPNLPEAERIEGLASIFISYVERYRFDKKQSI